ncbi:transcriptional regulator [Phyllobacterium zundukense]|uniref:Transcriptional regulator n=1 Tax=Phyllobacterium zundukense TaxID=1867719 RepID=A0A2N9VSL6_9HYPH|nr:transcriptional regulator [Phyllobacterium zundukense]ATU92898.1 transcriptional regulator [Phyllobacterium zundukense]PIO42484.1 transcriptional regulator [Phyllobacterium zundukense]
MNTVTVGVSSLDEAKQRLAGAFRGEKQGTFLTFASVELLWQTITPRRWDVIRSMTGQEAMTLRGLARKLERDVKTTHGDVHALLDAGILEKTADGRIVFPYDAVHVDFTITKAA